MRFFPYPGLHEDEVHLGEGEDHLQDWVHSPDSLLTKITDSRTPKHWLHFQAGADTGGWGATPLNTPWGPFDENSEPIILLNKKVLYIEVILIDKEFIIIKSMYKYLKKQQCIYVIQIPGSKEKSRVSRTMNRTQVQHKPLFPIQMLKNYNWKKSAEIQWNWFAPPPSPRVTKNVQIG